MRSSSSILPEKLSSSSFPPANASHESGFKKSNVYQLLAQREVCPRKKRTPRRFWGEVRNESAKDARQELLSWAEAESLQNLSAKYCPLVPPPRSTIAAAFSPDGSRLASTHGDHTVKINDSQTGKCLKVLSGHRRTPWAVRFHPLHPEIVASGSLDNEVRLWDSKTADCIGSRDFYRPIASMAFHAHGEILAVASGHKLYTWHYKRRGEDSSPTIILKTRRSLRAVHFHPHGAPFLLTAEVSDVDSPDSPSMTLATSHGYSQNVPPTIYLADAHSMYGSNHSTNELPVISARLFPIWLSMGTPGHQSEAAASMAAAAELPCTVKLRIWSHDVSNPCALLDAKRCRLTIPHVVLCSEMGAHFSPCGRFLAACVACILPNTDDADTTWPGFRASTSPTRHPLSSQQVMYELRIYSIEEATFGMVLASRAIRAAHCLTSIQFSPTSEHLLLAYGRRHHSLLNSVMVDGDTTTIPIYTILEMYRVSDMECVRAVTSAEDEVNVACFHPSVGGGLVYGTKEGKLSILQCNISQSFNGDPSDNMLA